MTLIALMIVIIPLIKNQKTAYVTAIVVTMSLPILSFILYLHWGSSEKLERYWLLQRQEVLVKADIAKIKNPHQLVDQLRAHLEAHPNSPKGWYLLGQIYLKIGEYQKSLSASEKAYQLKSDNSIYVAGYAEALYLNNKPLSSKVIALLNKSVKKQGVNIATINILAVNAYNHQHYMEAIRYWERLIPLFQPGSRDDRALLKMIARAQNELKKVESSRH